MGVTIDDGLQINDATLGQSRRLLGTCERFDKCPSLIILCQHNVSSEERNMKREEKNVSEYQIVSYTNRFMDFCFKIVLNCLFFNEEMDLLIVFSRIDDYLFLKKYGF